MNNRKQKNKRGKNPRQWMIQIIKTNSKAKNLENRLMDNRVMHLTENQK